MKPSDRLPLAPGLLHWTQVRPAARKHQRQQIPLDKDCETYLRLRRAFLRTFGKVATYKRLATQEQTIADWASSCAAAC
jgi:hypothetical protein